MPAPTKLVGNLRRAGRHRRALGLAFALIACARAAGPAALGLRWTTDFQHRRPAPGETEAAFEFVVSNRSDSDVLIMRLEASCGCTAAKLPAAACGICHDSPRRGSAVPRLARRKERDLAFWRARISEGKPRTMMPAFAEENGGPLTRAQISSLIQYLDQAPGGP